MINLNIKIHLKNNATLELQESFSINNLKAINFEEVKLKEILLKRFGVEDTSQYSINVHSAYNNRHLRLSECITNDTQIVIRCLLGGAEVHG
jgi:hypothetical protein